MPAFIPLALGGAAAIVSGRLLTKTPKAKLGDVLTDNPQPKSRLATKVDQVLTPLKPTLAEVDSHYQQVVQTHIDPLLGRQRQDYAKLLATDNQNQLVLSNEERYTNYRLGVGGLALVASGFGYLINPLFTGVAIVLGLSVMSHLYYYAYLQLKENPKLTGLHLVCIYLAFLWLGGYAAIGALGAVLSSIAFKVKVITEDQSRNNLLNLFQIQPATVWVRHADGLEITIPFEKLQVGDTLVLQAGQVVPVDGLIVAGQATIDQHMLTGEAQPVEKMVNESVMASTVVLSGQIDVRVDKTGIDTTAGQIVELLNQAADYNTAQAFKVFEMVDKLAWPTLILSAVSWPLVGPAGAISIMGANTTVVTYMTNPLSMLNFLNIAAERGVLIKDGAGLDTLNKVDTIVFDKTGTLTLDELQIAQLHPLTDIAPDELLRLAAAAERRQTHPIARAILAAAEARQLEVPPIDQAHYEIGYGIKVRLPEGMVRVGSHRFMVMENIPVPLAVEDLTVQSQAAGHSLVMVALNDKLVGCIELQPTIRPEVDEVVADLRQRGLALYIISGDQEAPTQKLANQFGMTGYFANTLPEQKADLVAKLQQEGRCVCFIGDGINDALAMRQADVSISLRGATSAATDTAQIILMEGNLKQLPYLFEIGQEFQDNLKTNFNFTAGTSLFVVGGILFAGFTFAATELFYVVSLLGGLGIAMKPVLEHGNGTRLIADNNVG